MEDKENKGGESEKLSESQFEENPPVEFIEQKKSSKEISTKRDVKHADLEKFKRGELGASYIGYNDDGSPHGSARKLDIETDTDPK